MPSNEFLKIADVADLFSVCSRTIRRAVAEGQFPKPVMIGKRAFWRRSDIMAMFDEATEPQPAEAD